MARICCFFEYFEISYTFLVNFLYKIGPSKGGGVKLPPKVPKIFFQAFNDISAQEKKNADKNLKKNVFLEHPKVQALNPRNIFEYSAGWGNLI